MKTLITLIAAACLVGTASGQQPNPSPTPGPEHKKLEIWVGDWTYETVAQASPLGPASTFTGKNTARPILNGWFMEFRGEDKGPSGTTQYTEIDGYEAADKRYRWTCFIGDGSVQDFTYTIDGSKVAYSGVVDSNNKSYPIRGTIILAADSSSGVDKREISADGKTWKPLWECRMTKVKSAAVDIAGVEQELIKLEDGWITALLKSDVAYCDRILADDYTETDDTGSVSTKAQRLAGLKSGDFKCTASVLENRQVRVYGDTAIFTALDTQKSQYNGKDSSGQFQWTDTWVRRDGRWQCVAAHGSKVPQK